LFSTARGKHPWPFMGIAVLLKTPHQTTPGERLVRMKEVKLLTGLGASTIYRLQAQGRFPHALYPFGHKRLAAWRYTDVAAWIAERCEGKAA
jgi:predicted DNA-binding transcriptional regulator AlpA